jgi:hypothetical protein
MLLLGGRNWRSNNAQTGIWQLKEKQWRRIGEFSKVWNIIKKKRKIFVSKPADAGSAIYVRNSVYYFEGYNSAIHRLDLDENEELDGVEEIGSQPADYYFHPVLFQTDNDYCT